MPSLSHKDDYLETPKRLVCEIENETGLNLKLDVACNEDNIKCGSGLGEEYNALTHDWLIKPMNLKVDVFCNPPRSKNGKFVTKAIEQWKEYNINIVMLLCWNDLGNRYCDYLRSLILSGSDKIKVVNLGKMIFDKNGEPTKFPSRLSYFWVWFKKQ